MINFLQMPNKLSNKKRRQINKSKGKVSIGETNSRKTTISSLKSSDKQELLVSIPATKKLETKVKDIDIAMIDTNVYCIAYYLKEA